MLLFRFQGIHAGTRSAKTFISIVFERAFALSPYMFLAASITGLVNIALNAVR